jgi:4-diphosphocytidyl-2-C-methyl-D-erythritol kinase
MKIPAFAKVNLTLKLLGKRPDGFHALESVMQMVTLADTLVLEEADEFRFTCSEPALAGADNLVVRAAHLLGAHCAGARGVHLHLEKHIPVQAGLGGGSSDAAAALVALNEFWQVRLPLEAVRTLAARLGSDVPFFLDGPAALVQGRGERVTPLQHHAALPLVLVQPAHGLSTAAVYGRVRVPAVTAREHWLPETTAMVRALELGSPTRVATALVNDLEYPALTLYPELAMYRERLFAHGCLGVLLCGSGSALLGLCADTATAERAARELRHDCPWTTSCTFLPPPLGGL